jgi:hypothetical protein
MAAVSFWCLFYGSCFLLVPFYGNCFPLVPFSWQLFPIWAFFRETALNSPIWWQQFSISDFFMPIVSFGVF